MPVTLTIFSGLPGTGKSSLAESAARQLRQPLLRLDDLMGFIPQPMLDHADPLWDTVIGIMLNLAEAQLQIGVSVIIDAVFMGDDRSLARQIATRQHAEFRPIYTHVSNEAIWRERVDKRFASLPADYGVATWERIQEQRKLFHPGNLTPPSLSMALNL
jgi:predicted kinase